MPAQHTPILNTCQLLDVPADPTAGPEPTLVCDEPAAAHITAVYAYDAGKREFRVDDVLCAGHGTDLIRDLMSGTTPALQTWHARSLAAAAIPTQREPEPRCWHCNDTGRYTGLLKGDTEGPCPWCADLDQTADYNTGVGA